MPLFYAESDYGCGLFRYPDHESAVEGITSTVGARNYPRNIRIATDEDVAWVLSMGGHVPSEEEEMMKEEMTKEKEEALLAKVEALETRMLFVEQAIDNLSAGIPSIDFRSRSVTISDLELQELRDKARRWDRVSDALKNTK